MAIFSAYLVKTEDVVLEVLNGKQTRFGLVFMATEEDASRAIADLNKAMIREKEIVVYSPTMNFKK